MTRVAVSVVALTAVACGPSGDEDRAEGPSVGPTISTRFRPYSRFENISTVAEAITALETTIQEVYHLGVIDSGDGLLLLKRAKQSEDEYQQGDIGEAFAQLQSAHAFIEASVIRGLASSDEGALQLHQAIDVIGALMATN